MKSQRPARRLWTAVACVAIAGATSGCATLLRYGVETAAESVTHTPNRPSPQMRSAYERAPALYWFAGLQPRPHSVVVSVFDGPGFRGGCQPVPIGLQQLTQVPNGAPAMSLQRIGPIELGVQGLVSNLFTPGYFDRVANDGLLLYSAAAMADLGSACGFQSFFYVRIASTMTTQLPIHR